MGIANWMVRHLRRLLQPGRIDRPARRFRDHHGKTVEADQASGRDPFPQKAILDAYFRELQNRTRK
jgi:hypothetical protein